MKILGRVLYFIGASGLLYALFVPAKLGIATPLAIIVIATIILRIHGEKETAEQTDESPK